MQADALKTITLYQKNGWKKWFAYWRFWAAPYLYVEKLIPEKGTIIELGCGEGLFSNFLAISNKGRTVLGVELDSNRLKVANKKLKNTKFIVGNAVTTKLPSADSIVMFHLLHHLNSRQEQEILISNALKALKKNGKLIIVEIDRDFSPKFYFTSFWDHFVVPWVFEKRLYQPNIHFRTQAEWKKCFRSLKAVTKSKKDDKGMPFRHIIYEVSK